MENMINRNSNFCFFIVLSFLSLTISKNAGATILISDCQIIQTVQKDSIKQGNYLIQIIAGTNCTYGYNIYKGKKLFIHQPTIPALPGNSGFATKADAEKVARLVVEKMKKGEPLPTITVDELKQLKLIPEQ